jgi:NADP-dependent 3-hydroxy acid dehydrogenase YdfG
MMDTSEFRGAVAVITGAASGIGAGLARHAAGLGMAVALVDVDTVLLDALATRLRQEGAEVMARPVDVASAEAVDELAAAVHARWGDVRVLVNNAGIDTHGEIWRIPPSHWKKSIEVNLTGVYHGIRSFVPRMIAADRPAQVVNVASVAALSVRPYMAPYMATKHACMALTECLDQELRYASRHVRASAVLPGAVRTRIFSSSTTADTDTDGPGTEQRARLIDELAAHGIEADAAAAIIFAGIARGDLWIHTHPNVSDARIRARAQTLLGRVRPALAD